MKIVALRSICFSKGQAGLNGVISQAIRDVCLKVTCFVFGFVDGSHK